MEQPVVVVVVEDKVAVAVVVEDRVAVVAWMDHMHHKLVVAVGSLLVGIVVEIVALVGMIAEQQVVVVAVAAGNCHKHHKVVVELVVIVVVVVVVGEDTCHMLAEEPVDASLEEWPEEAVAVVVDGIAEDHMQVHHHIVVTFDNQVVLHDPTINSSSNPCFISLCLPAAVEVYCAMELPSIRSYIVRACKNRSFNATSSSIISSH